MICHSVSFPAKLKANANANVECYNKSLLPSLFYIFLPSVLVVLTSVDVLGSQVASLGLDERMPLGEECDSYAFSQSGGPAMRTAAYIPHMR